MGSVKYSIQAMIFLGDHSYFRWTGRKRRRRVSREEEEKTRQGRKRQVKPSYYLILSIDHFFLGAGFFQLF